MYIKPTYICSGKNDRKCNTYVVSMYIQISSTLHWNPMDLRGEKFSVILEDGVEQFTHTQVKKKTTRSWHKSPSNPPLWTSNLCPVLRKIH